MLKSSISVSSCYRKLEMCFQTVFLIILLGHSLGFEIFEEEKRQQLYPFPRVGRSGYWALVDDKRQSGLVPFPRVGRDGKRQGLIPFPRIGRSVDMDYDSSLPDLDDWMDDIPYEVSSPVYKRGKFSFTPRIGRRKRSINPQDNQRDNSEMSKTLGQTPSWQLNAIDPEDFEETSYYFRPDRQMIPVPRIGRGSFIPRVGKKRSDVEFGDSAADKRAGFTPRIGRAALVPRIGRSDPSIQTRAGFTPRIGRAALQPRVGRSDKSEYNNGNPSSN